jgi:hypothetical protein|eukprot:COSAG01_NODE_1019_length_12097_cov_7.650942_11_plen_153_part_00
MEEKLRVEEVDGEMLALYGARGDHMLLKQDMHLSAGRARALHATISAFVSERGGMGRDGAVAGATQAAQTEANVAAAARAAAEAEAEARRRMDAHRAALQSAIHSATAAQEYHKLSDLVAQLQAVGGAGRGAGAEAEAEDAGQEDEWPEGRE